MRLPPIPPDTMSVVPLAPRGTAAPPPPIAAFAVDTLFRMLRDAVVDLRIPSFTVGTDAVVTLLLHPDSVQKDTIIVEPAGDRQVIGMMRVGDEVEACLDGGPTFDIRSGGTDDRCTTRGVAAGAENSFTWMVTPLPGDSSRTLVLTLEPQFGGRALPAYTRKYVVRVRVAPCDVFCQIADFTSKVTIVNASVAAATTMCVALIVPAWRWARRRYPLIAGVPRSRTARTPVWLEAVRLRSRRR